MAPQLINIVRIHIFLLLSTANFHSPTQTNTQTQESEQWRLLDVKMHTPSLLYHLAAQSLPEKKTDREQIILFGRINLIHHFT